MSDNYYVHIWLMYPEKRIEKTMGPFSKRKAEKVEDGLDAQLDHEFYMVEVVNGDEDGH